MLEPTGEGSKTVPESLHIVLVISSLSAGGAERIMSMMANYWAQQGRRVTLITIDSCEADFYALESGVHRIGLSLLGQSENIFEALSSNYTRLMTLRRVIKSLMPDVIVSFVDRTNVLCLVACVGSKIPVIVSERIDPRKHDAGRIWSFLRKWVYPRAASVVVQTIGVQNWMSKRFDNMRIDAIPNPVPSNNSYAKNVNIDLPEKAVVAIGRLHPQKGFDVLIDAFSQCTRKYPDWVLVIFGEGPERKKLESLVKRLGLEGRVRLPGRIRNPERVIGAAEIFVLSSRYEGFPNVLLEAMACGLPAIATDCQAGPKEIINNGFDGVLVPVEDRGAMTDNLLRLMSDPDERSRLGENARNSIKRYSLPIVMKKWEDLLQQVLHG